MKSIYAMNNQGREVVNATKAAQKAVFAHEANIVSIHAQVDK